jgi:hypothetical protein
MYRRISSVITVAALITIVVISIVVHFLSEHIYFGNGSVRLFWLSSIIGTIGAIVTGLRGIDILTERTRVVN